jgi:hypothetical protein
MAKTYYPTFKRDVHSLALFLARNQAALVNRLALAGSSYETDLTALVSALNQIEAHWPPYVEPQ